MSDPKQGKSPNTETVDWAERLRASMNTERPESAPSVTVPDEEDDLAALLRAQLARQSAAPEPDLPDTSDFEEEEEILDEDEEEIFDEEEEILDEEEEILDEEEEILDDEEEILEDEEEIFDEEEEILDEEEEILDEEEEILDEEEEILDEEEEIFDDEEEILDEGEEEILDEDEEEIFDDEEEILDDEEEILDEEEEILDDDEEEIFDDEEDLEDHEVPGISRELYRRSHVLSDEANASSEARLMTDERLTGRGLDRSAVGADSKSDRRRRLSDENARLLEDMERRRAIAIHPEGHPGSELGPMVEPDPAAHTEGTPTDAPRTRTRPAAIGYDPLQVGYANRDPSERTGEHRRTVAEILDDEMPVASPAPRPKRCEPAPAGTEVSDDAHVRDAALWTDLGYTAEIRHAEDRRAAERARAEDRTEPADADAEVHSRKKSDETPRAHFLRECRSCKLRLIIAAVGTCLMLIYDALPAILSLIEKGSERPASPVYPVVGLVWMLLMGLPFLPRLARGVVGLCRLAPARYSVTSLSYAVNLLYACVAVAASAVAEVAMPLFGSVTLCMLTVTALAEYLEARGEWDAYELTSAGRAIHVLTDEPTIPSSLAHTHPTASPTLTAMKTARADHVFDRMRQYNPAMARLNLLLPAALFAAIVCGGASLLRGGDPLTDALRIFTAVYLAALPAAYLVAMSLPLRRTNRHLTEHGCAVIGTATPALYDGDGERAVCIHDNEVIAATRRKEITLRADADGNDRHAAPPAYWRRMANRLFRLLNSPLAVDLPFDEDGSPEATACFHAEIAETGPHFMRVYLIDETPGHEETLEVMLGSHEALNLRGIRLPRRTMEEAYRKSEDSHVLYLAFDGHFRIAYATEYRVNRRFRITMEALAACHARPVMVTYDPMLTDELLAEPRFAAIRGMEVVRPAHVEIPRSRVSSGLVATTDGQDLIHPLLGCRAMKTCYRAGLWLSVLGAVAAMGLSLAAILAGHDLWIHAASAVLLQVAMTALAVLATVLGIGKRKLGLNPEKPEKTKEPPKNPDKTA